MGVALGTVEAVSGFHAPACLRIRFRPHFEDCATAFKDEYNLATVIVSMHPDSSTGYELPLEYAVRAVEEHVGGEFLLAALEIRKDGQFYFVKIYCHV